MSQKVCENVQMCDRTSHTLKSAARTHLARTFQNAFRTHIAHVLVCAHVCVCEFFFATHRLKFHILSLTRCECMYVGKTKKMGTGEF